MEKYSDCISIIKKIEKSVLRKNSKRGKWIIFLKKINDNKKEGKEMQVERK
jgi:hypothetical protein